MMALATEFPVASLRFVAEARLEWRLAGAEIAGTNEYSAPLADRGRKWKPAFAARAATLEAAVRNAGSRLAAGGHQCSVRRRLVSSLWHARTYPVSGILNR